MKAISTRHSWTSLPTRCSGLILCHFPKKEPRYFGVSFLPGLVHHAGHLLYFLFFLSAALGRSSSWPEARLRSRECLFSAQAPFIIVRSRSRASHQIFTTFTAFGFTCAGSFFFLSFLLFLPPNFHSKQKLLEIRSVSDDKLYLIKIKSVIPLTTYEASYWVISFLFTSRDKLTSQRLEQPTWLVEWRFLFRWLAAFASSNWCTTGIKEPLSRICSQSRVYSGNLLWKPRFSRPFFKRSSWFQICGASMSSLTANFAFWVETVDSCFSEDFKMSVVFHIYITYAAAGFLLFRCADIFLLLHLSTDENETTPFRQFPKASCAKHSSNTDLLPKSISQINAHNGKLHE